MGRVEKSLLIVVLLATGLNGCGLYVPEKDVLVNDNVQTGKFSPQGLLENRIVGHIRCEIRDGIIDALVFPQVQWLKKWGATVTLKLTVEDQSALAPGVSLLSPLGTSVNAFPGPQSFSLGLGLTGAANATRLETIAYTYTFKDLISEGKSECDVFKTGVRMQSDLKIRQFIYDKAVIAAVGESATANPEYPPYSTFQEDITFLASYGGSVTPTWKFARVTADTSGTTLSATRTSTDEVLITLGKVLKEATKDSPAQLSPDAQAVHNTGLTGTATGSAVSSQTR